MPDLIQVGPLKQYIKDETVFQFKILKQGSDIESLVSEAVNFCTAHHHIQGIAVSVF